jgi:UDP-N-acetylmuramate dehydrogenase
LSYELLLAKYDSIPSYPVSNELIKIPAGWLIERCGWKGYKKGDIGVHVKKAIVLVNYGNAKGSEIWKLSDDIVTTVKGEFNIVLEREVQVW